jgi:hypothetical protein
MTPEKRFENRLCEGLKKVGIFARHFDTVGLDGWPDITVLHNDSYYLIECKYHTCKLRDDQKALHARLLIAYGITKIIQVSELHDEFYVCAHNSSGFVRWDVHIPTFGDLVTFIRENI